MPDHIGQNNLVCKVSADALRHGNTGAIDINVSNAIPIGTVSRSKNGSPTAIWRSCKASMINGNTVPSKTTNAKTAKITLFAKNAASRDNGESMMPGLRSLSPRQPIRKTETTNTTAKNERNHAPIPLSLNACTLFNTPERVKKVPRIVKLKVATSNEIFHTRNIPRRSCTNTEWI